MATIEEIIKAIDEELIESGKQYLLLSQANQLLINKNIISVSEKADNLLKRILEEGGIPHACQTEKTPKQWRIPLSDARKQRKINLKGKTTTREQTIINKARSNNGLTKQDSFKLTKIQVYWLIVIVVMVVLGIIGGNMDNNSNEPFNHSDNAYGNDLSQSTPTEKDNSINLSDFTGQRFTFKSTLNDKEVYGEIVQTNHETTYHTFDFIKMTVTQKSSLNGKWVTITYPMMGFYKEEGTAASTYVIKVNQLGVKEIWFSPDVPNLGYDFDNGTRIACYNVTKE